MTRRSILSVTLLAACCVFGKDRGKMSNDLKGVDPQSAVNIIVQFVHAPEQPHLKKVTANGGVLNATLDVVKGGAFTVPGSSLESLAKDPQVAYVSLDRPLKPTLEY